MRFAHLRRFSRRAAAAAAGLVLSVGVLGCPKHENFPTQLELVVPPTPGNFLITDLGWNATSGTYDYDLTWSISDPTTVDRYRIYLLDVGPTPDLQAETTNTQLPITSPIQITGLRLAVSAVSTENVEGHSATATCCDSVVVNLQ